MTWLRCSLFGGDARASMCTFVPTPIQDARIIGTYRPYEVLTTGIKAPYPPSPYPPKGPYDRSSRGATLLLKKASEE